jgi:hypothetical protein
VAHCVKDARVPLPSRQAALSHCLSLRPGVGGRGAAALTEAVALCVCLAMGGGGGGGSRGWTATCTRVGISQLRPIR